MAFLLALLSIVVAEEVVKLEPVTAPTKLEPLTATTNNYGCNALSGTTAADILACNSDPYCFYATGITDTSKICIDDPCLNYSAVPEANCPGSKNLDVDGVIVTCGTAPRNVPNYQNHDCADSGSGAICQQVDKSVTSITYCEYTQLKDGKCPDSICMASLNGVAAEKHCIKNNVQYDVDYPCRPLTKTDCLLVPKCFWNSSGSGQCQADKCFQKKTATMTCEGLTGNLAWSDVKLFEPNTCVEWHPYSSVDGTVLDYCIHKDNKDANICYFGNINISDNTYGDHRSDYSSNWLSNVDPGTYPTYNYGTANPDCSATVPGCDDLGPECVSIVNQRGALAGRYCSDGKHAAANILHIPSLIVLAVSLVAIFSL